ncbi:MAG: hypothetical protein ACRYGF_14725 [Janthinobacterium lividum]
MPEILKTPEFKTEQEEAEWWDSSEGRAVLLKGFQDAKRNGTLGRGTLKKAGGLTPTTTIRLDLQDIELAKAQAEKRGLKYQTYLKSIIHQALRQEAGL